MGALGSCSSLFQEYTVHTSRLFFLYRVSSYPIQNKKTQPTLQVSVEVKGPEIEILKSGKMLTDKHVNLASAIIKKDFQGLQSTLTAQWQKGFKSAEEGSIPSASLWWQLSALGYNMLHGRLRQLRENESHFNPRTQKADNELYGMTAGDGGDLNIAVSQVQKQSGRVTADVLQLLGLCTSLMVTNLKLYYWTRYNSFEGMSTQAAVHTLSTHVHAHKHFLLTWTSFTLHI